MKKRLLSILLIIILIIPNVDTALAMGGNQEIDAIEEGQNPVVDEDTIEDLITDSKGIEPLNEQTNMEDLISDLPEENMPKEEEKQNLEEAENSQAVNDKIQSHTGNTRAGNITDKVVVNGPDISIGTDDNRQYIIKDGIKVPGAPEIKVGDIINLDYFWNIPDNKMPVEEGSVFEIVLPDDHYVFVKPSGEIDLIDAADGEKLGVWKVEAGKIIVVLNENGANSEGIFNGFFELTGKADVAGEDISVNGDNNLTIDIKPSDDGGGGGEEPGVPGHEDIGAYPPDKVKFTKNGLQYHDENRLNWSMNINYDGLISMVESDTITPKTDMILVDHIAEGLEIDEESFYITAPMFLPTKDGKMGDLAIQYLKLKDVFPIIKPADSEDYDSFYNRVKTTNTPVIGIFEETNTILIGFGDVPGNGLTYAGILGGVDKLNEYIEDLESQGSISPAQATQMKKVYGPDSNTGGQITGYDISFDTKVTGESGDYTNEATLIYNDGSEDKDSVVVKFEKYTGGAETSDKVSKKVEKVWDDNNNQDGIRPTSIEVQLLADGVAKGDPVTLNQGNNWSHTWSGLPEKNNGQTIIYTVKEISSVDGYVTTYDQANLVITNTHDPEEISKTVVKNWVGDTTATRPGSIEVQLLADNVPSGDPVELNEGNGWSYTWDHLDKYEDGNEIIYTVKEVGEVPGYTVSYSTDKFTITNTYTPGETSKTVSKVWNDSNNQDGIRPTSIEVQLLADGAAEGAPVTLNQGNNWSHTWTELPEKNNGQVITYTVKEISSVDGYVTTYDQANLVITNTHDPEEISKTVVKNWVGDTTATRPGSIEVQLLADNVPSGAPVELNEGNGWSYTWDHLDKYEDGNEIIYTVKEVGEVPGYTVSYSDDTFTITNTYTPGETSKTVRKVWNDNNNQDGIRPTSIEVQLLADGAAEGDPVTLNQGNNWSHTWTELQEKNNGQNIIYTVEEISSVAGYETTYDQGNLVITNTHDPEEIIKTVEKNWVGDTTATRPESIEVQLLADNVPSGAPVELNEGNGWSYTWDYLDKYEDGVEISYTVKEVGEVPGYTVSYSDDTFTITNTYTPGETSKTVRKVWNDNNNQDGIRPTSIEVQLLADGAAEGAPVTLNQGNNWSHTWTELPEKNNGQVITYTVKEISSVDGYVTTYDQANLVITNTHDPEEISKTVVKEWVGDTTATRPASIEVQLLADNVPSGDPVELNEGNGWSYTWDHLDKYEDGVEISYTVKEVGEVPGYTVSYSDDTFTITNTYTPGETSKTVRKVWNDSNNQDGIRPTSIEVQLLADGVEKGDPVTLNQGNNWRHTWTELPEKNNGQNIIYTVKEISSVAGYETTYDQGNLVITNTHTPAKTSKTVEKKWDDNNDQHGVRPDNITVQLYANGENIGNSVVLNKENKWSHNWTGLEKYKGGVLIQYTIDELEVPEHYETSQITQGDLTTITNKYIDDNTPTNPPKWIAKPRPITTSKNSGSNVKTGDDTKIITISLMLLISAGALTTLIIKKRKRS